MRNRRYSALFATTLFVLAVCGIGGRADANDGRPKAVYLSDASADLIISSRQGFGTLGWDTAVKPFGRAAMPLRIKDRGYRRGLGHHAPGEILVDLGGWYKTFEADLGVQWQGGGKEGSVVFQVFVDDDKRFESRVIRQSDPPQHVSVAVEGGELLKLVVTDAGDGITCDCADWADARLIPAATPAAAPNAQNFMDVAHFARVVTSDPKRMRGTRALRTQEFPAEDFELSRAILPDDDGSYRVPHVGHACRRGPSPQAGCIGLEWLENRLPRSVGLEFAKGFAMPDLKAVQVQCWIGESPWQGQWKPLDSIPQVTGRTAVWPVRYRQVPSGTPKVRWVFPAGAAPIVIERFQAITRSRAREMSLSLECEGPQAGQPCSIELYNGALLSGRPLITSTFAKGTVPFSSDENWDSPQLVLGRPLRGRFAADHRSVAVSAARGGQDARAPVVKQLLKSEPGASAFGCIWDTRQPLKLRVRYSDTSSSKTDRTVVRLAFAHASRAIAVEDLLSHDCVYVPSVGLFAVRQPAPITLAEYRRKIAGRKTILDDVRQRPDQTLAQAMAKTHHPIQDLGPMMISLACDNRKFVVEREGTVWFNAYQRPDDPPIDKPTQYRLTPRFGNGEASRFSRHLDGGWLPMPVTTVSEQGLQYQQCSYVAPLEAEAPAGTPAWLRDRAVGVVEYEIANPSDHAIEAKLELKLHAGQKTVAWQAAGGRCFVMEGDRLVAMADARQAPSLKLSREGDALRLSGTVPASGGARMAVYLPAWKVSREAFAKTLEPAGLRALTIRYWKDLLQPAMQVELPDAFMTDILRASQVHCLLAARNELRGRRVSPWISSDRYGPLESEANSILHGMGLWGHRGFERRGLDFFLARYNDAGYLTTGYTVVGTGWNLWTLAEYFELTQDRGWLQQAAPTVARACRWIVCQRAKTRRLDAQGRKVPGYGLMPPGVSADWNRYAQRFFNDAHYATGLAAAARALKAIGDPAADEMLRDAAVYRDELEAAFHWSQVRSPVVPLRNGVWTMNHPGIVGFLGNVEDFTPGEDGNRSWAASVEIGSHYLPALGLLDANGQDATAMVNYLEDYQFLRDGWFDYPAAASQKDPFNLGGFAKVQPFYGRIVEVYARRDEVKPLVRSYFNALSSLLSRENLSLWEHFHNGGGWNKTHETGWFLAQSRLLFVQERGRELWLAPFLTTAWLEDGMRVKVDRAPTRFGEVGYEIRSRAADGTIEATIRPPVRAKPEAIVLRLRHPEGKRMRKVLVNDQPYDRFDPARETITLASGTESIRVRAEY